VKEKEQRKLQAEAEAEALKQSQAAEISQGYAERKARRKIVAGKSTHIANFLQRASISAAQGSRLQRDLLELYTKASRINLELWNEFESPTVKEGIKEDSWNEIVDLYQRGSELTGTVIVIDGERFSTTNPWDRPAPAAEGEE
jgi:hypothetical protein